MTRSTRKPPRSMQPPPAGPWFDRLAWALACAVFPLVWMGGLVTSYDAGMAVPDWPTTFGHWFYPLQQWLWKVNDLFLEHGHRTIAQAVGLLAIALAVAIWRRDGRKWMRWMALLVVGGVILQGTLGGLRVLFDARGLAALHGCTAPLFFALCGSIVVLTSDRWQAATPAESHPAARNIRRLAVGTAVGIYLLVVLGAQLRHVAPAAPHGWFVPWVWIKVIAAGVVASAVCGLWIYVRRRAGDRPTLVRRAALLAGLTLVQLLLGVGAWVTNYNLPAWFRNWVGTIPYTIRSEGPLQAWTTTAHAATGSLMLVVAVSMVLWSYRLLTPRPNVNEGVQEK
jgi:cytochrome c oxidase assembly protein subunit 15